MIIETINLTGGTPYGYKCGTGHWYVMGNGNGTNDGNGGIYGGGYGYGDGNGNGYFL